MALLDSPLGFCSCCCCPPPTACSLLAGFSLAQASLHMASDAADLGSPGFRLLWSLCLLSLLLPLSHWMLYVSQERKELGDTSHCSLASPQVAT